MDNNEKLSVMDKIIRELEDINNSSTSLLKKVAQVEAENINLGDKVLEEKLPDLHEKIDAMVTESATLMADYTEVREKFYTDNNMGAATEKLRKHPGRKVFLSWLSLHSDQDGYKLSHTRRAYKKPIGLRFEGRLVLVSSTV